MKWLKSVVSVLTRYHVLGSIVIVLATVSVISSQITDRNGFANGKLRADVMDRWGAPVGQSAPSVLFVESGSVFKTLHPITIQSQKVTLDAKMNYRKRGLVYFSGFEFTFKGRYKIQNPFPHAIDVVFVFPIQFARRTMVSDLSFLVDGKAARLPLSEAADKLTWTGRLAGGEGVSFEIVFRGRGLESFTYFLDPDLPVKDLTLDVWIDGGANYDYGAGVVPATSISGKDEKVRLHWEFKSLETGFPLGIILPSEKSFDAIIRTMVRRCWATFLLFLASVIALATFAERRLERYETYLIAAVYAFFFVLLPYLAAYMNFYVAYVLSVLAIGGMLRGYLIRIIGHDCAAHALGLIGAFLVFPTVAVILENHTGLIYSLEILAALSVLMVLTTRPAFRRVLGEIGLSLPSKEAQDAN